MRTLAVILVVVACSSRVNHEAARPPAQHVQEPVARAPRAPIEPIGPSVYELDIELRDSNDRRIGIDVDRGHPTLISMFYASCTTACPVLVRTMKNIAAQAPAHTRLMLVSFDAGRDTPERLRELIAAHGLDSRWTLASADEPTARTLAAVLGVKYRATAAGEFFHNTVFVALDRNGQPRARMEGIDDPADLVAALAQ